MIKNRIRNAIAALAIGTTIALAAGVGSTGATAAAPSGQSMPATAPAGWKLKFSDDFATNVALGSFPAANPKWGAYSGPDSTKHGTYSAAKTISQTGGLLNINLHTENGVPLVAGIIPKVTAMTYGRYAIRWRADAAPGYKQVFLLWPNSGQRSEGEMDFPERNLTTYPYTMGFLHRLPTVGPLGWAKVTLDANQWHTTVIEWTPGMLRYFLDGTKVYETTLGVPHTPFHLVLQNETQISGGAPRPAATVKGNVQIDWVQVFDKV